MLVSPGEQNVDITCKRFLEKHGAAWIAATRSSFLNRCKDGTLKPRQFNTWLLQDYLFVIELTRVAARLLAAAPVTHFDVILGGMTSLRDELNWFRAKAAERKLELNVPPQAVCQRYCQFLDGLSTEPYVVQATAFWAIEAVYNQAWQLAAPVAAPYDEFANRWGNPDFTVYVGLLERQADEVLRDAPRAAQERAEELLLSILELEQLFWQMAFEGAADSPR
jgi:thiaminase